MKENIQRYTSLFKENAVLLSYKNKSVIETAKELNISPKLLSKWRIIYLKYAKGSFPGRGHKRVYYNDKKIYQLELKLAESKML